MLKETLNLISPIEDAAWMDFNSKCVEKTYQKDEFICTEGQIFKHLVFLQKGLIRSFSNSEHKEITHTFYDKGSLFYDDHSFLSTLPSRKSYITLEESNLIMISKHHLYELYDKYKSFERLGRIAVEMAHIRMIENQERINQNTAEENYVRILANHPDIIQRVPQKIIASYLNISTEHLSRVRTKLASS